MSLNLLEPLKVALLVFVAAILQVTIFARSTSSAATPTWCC